MQHPPESELFNAYLSELRSHLQALPSKAQARSLEETRQHLQGIHEQLTSEGWTSSDAATEAICRFGKASDIGKRLKQELKLTGLSKLSEAAKHDLRTLKISNDIAAITYAFGVAATAYLAWFVLLLTVMTVTWLAWKVSPVQFIQLFSSPKVWWVDRIGNGIWFLAGAYPLVVGVIVGRKTPERALMAVMHVVLGLTALACLLLMVITSSVHQPFPVSWLSVPTYCLVAAEVSAFLAGCAKRGRFYRPTMNDLRFRQPETSDDDDYQPATAS